MSPRASRRRNSGQVAQSPHQVRVGDQHPRRPLVGLKDAHRTARLHQHGLVGFERRERAHQRVEAAPVARRLPGAAVDHQVVGSFGDLGIEVVLQHAQRRLLRPARALTASVPRAARTGRAPSMTTPSCYDSDEARDDVEQLAACARSSPTAAISGASQRSWPGPPVTSVYPISDGGRDGRGARAAREAPAPGRWPPARSRARRGTRRAIVAVFSRRASPWRRGPLACPRRESSPRSPATARRFISEYQGRPGSTGRS